MYPSKDGYVSDDGYTMRREQGIGPNGNSISGKWVLRNPDGKWINCDMYRDDLASSYGFKIN